MDIVATPPPAEGQENTQNIAPATPDIGSEEPALGHEQPKKSGRGRPKGSKNKAKKARKTRATSSDDSAADPFADAPRPTAAETAAAEGAAVPVEPVEAPKQKLGIEGAAVAVEMLFATVRTVDGLAAWWLVKKKAPEIHAAATEALHLTEGEKDRLRPLLVARLAEMEMSPDDLLLWAVVGIYAGKVASVGALVDAAKTRTIDVTQGA